MNEIRGDTSNGDSQLNAKTLTLTLTLPNFPPDDSCTGG